jgi:hypothetical protein
MRMPQPVSAVPSSPEEFIRLYRDYVVHLVRKLGIPDQDCEDVANDILEKELKARNRLGQEVGILALYDPEHEAVVRGERKKVTFRAFLSARVALRLRGKRETLQRRQSRELLICDSTVDGTQNWLDLFGASVTDDYSHLDAEEWLAAMRDRLARVPRSSPGDSCDLIALFDELVSQIQRSGAIDRAAVQVRFDVADTTVTNWISRLRSIMGAVPGTELPAPESHVIGGVTLTLADVRQALNILRSAPGIMVRQPLARAGHPLAGAESGWYHPFAKQEIADFPEIAIDPQTHRKPAGHVKIAVIHRLERMLGFAMAESAPPAEPEPEPEPESPADLLEAKLWAAGIQDVGVVDEIKAMAEELERYRSQGVTAA